MNPEKIKKRLFEHYGAIIKDNPNIIYLALQGSQNYRLDYEDSDIDTKALVVPPFRSIVLNHKPVSYTHIMENDEHCDVKDVRLMFDCFKKQNINFLEILFSDYFLVNERYQEEVQLLRERADDIAHYNNYAAVNCMAGMAMEKFKALKHPYPTIKWKIDKWGYDGKQLHHILRMEQFLSDYIEGYPFETCLTSFPKYDKAFLIAVKTNFLSLEVAEAMAKESMGRINKMKKDYMENVPLLVNKEVGELMNDILFSIFKKAYNIN